MDKQNTKTAMMSEVVKQLTPYRGPHLCFITFTLKSKLYKYSSYTQFEITKNEAYGYLNESCDMYIILPEHTATSNIHYHCIGLFRDVLSKIAFSNRVKKSKMLGMTHITKEPIQSEEQLKRTVEYLFKDADVTSSALHLALKKIIMTKELYLDNLKQADTQDTEYSDIDSSSLDQLPASHTYERNGHIWTEVDWSKDQYGISPDGKIYN